MLKWTPCEGTNLNTVEGNSLLFKSYTMGPHCVRQALLRWKNSREGAERGKAVNRPKATQWEWADWCWAKVSGHMAKQQELPHPSLLLRDPVPQDQAQCHTSSGTSAPTLSAPWHTDRSSVNVNIIGSLYHHHFCYLWLLKLWEGYEGFWENYSSFTI